MQAKLKLIAVAAALAASGLAGATSVKTFTNGNSSLVFFAIDNAAPGASMSIDLGKSFTDFVTSTSNVNGAGTASGTSWEWNFGTDQFLVNGVAVTGYTNTGNWSAVNTFFKSNVQAADVKFGVIAGNDVDVGYLSTRAIGANSIAQPSANTGNMGLVNTLFLNINGTTNVAGTSVTTIGSTAAAKFGGAATTDFSGQYGVASSANLGGGLDWQINFGSSAAVGASSKAALYYLDGNIETGARTFITGDTVGSAFSYDYANNTLSWGTAAPIPEPGTYAMLLAGLAAVGMVVRRRSVR